MDILKKTLDESSDRKEIPEGLWIKCDYCQQILWKKEIERNLYVCTKCNYHFRISAEKRFSLLFDFGQYSELFGNIIATDPLHFKDSKSYASRLKQLWEKLGLIEAIRVAEGTIGGKRALLCVMVYDFIGGSMGSVVGEKVTRAVEFCIKSSCPLIIISASGGARMQEGAFSLMQMAKISCALARLDDAGIAYISILTDPTTGGVTASYGMLGDLIIAEPRALIGFAGPRVIEQTIKQKLPDDFQKAEFLLLKGMLDAVVPRKDLKKYLEKILHFYNP
ncbi:MAG: acetyl-CoA carboxylase subunit beta [Candidatus Fischerbacteria bacterium RBG_13_37_8]|uniref:Acetyl-coenzyme A carboxylase carboxyl transferase subunit beta n=1 Tax=Candidatus Fischerbacteria bacterium RBG_13_37_8 TaxID=1817863 RepID=A0A1F5VKV7_9BACT|nr:MAG: acetyl-CoA carboxylase subunit beta [Candidatus Fischerbacteria bacterium RBG_13_37_8]